MERESIRRKVNSVIKNFMEEQEEDQLLEQSLRAKCGREELEAEEEGSQSNTRDFGSTIDTI